MSDPHAYNLLPDPKPVATVKWVVPSSRDVRVQTNGLYPHVDRRALVVVA